MGEGWRGTGWMDGSVKDCRTYPRSELTVCVQVYGSSSGRLYCDSIRQF